METMRVKVPEEWRGLVGSEYIDILEMGELRTSFTKEEMQEVAHIKTYSYEDHQKREKKKGS